ncbi:MAG: ABC transporter permease subunit, partial [Rhodopila sp.]
MSTAAQETLATRFVLIGLTVAVLGVLLLLPLVIVLVEAFAKGVPAALRTLDDPESLTAIRLTLIVAAISVPLNTVFGVSAAWCISRFRFPGRGLLTTLIDLPFSVSPVISGLVWVLLFGVNGLLGRVLERADIQVIFALPGLILATVFVTFPFVARTLIPLMQEQDASEEEAAITLGATGWQTFSRVTLPGIRWGLVYGVL